MRSGPWVPARIWLVDGERDPETGELLSDQELRCAINGKDRDPYEVWTWLCGHPISRQEYDSMTRVATWAAGSTAPEGLPTERVDLVNQPPVF